MDQELFLLTQLFECYIMSVSKDTDKQLLYYIK